MNSIHLIRVKCLAVFAVLSVCYAVAAGADDMQGKVATLSPTTGPATTKPTAEDLSITGTETLVFLRHGEKPAHDLGQLTPQGLNRAIALSKLLPAKYGKPDFLFAPLTLASRNKDGSLSYFYIRPLMTIEPTAIVLGMPVQTPFGFSQIDQLDAELTLPKYAKSLIFIAWEHGKEVEAMAKLMTQFGSDGKLIPHWHSADFDSLYVLKIVRTVGQPSRITFTHDHEGLDHLSTEMPEPAGAGR